ncbi:hypothetical protein GS399_02235 [Pedobacter sp. HMF7647]|uniref:Uncharacterized protein n=1 Tax=Hufsiella arboris TaxID=2695275 RepID=A0A7K1Y5A6_9SPHI|nr:hypothetical protein [Hufsiella arboris]MXV49773.1 hypothetical protein [Hufsiella arboris]
MKRTFFILASLLVIVGHAQSQVKLDKAVKAASSAGFDVKSITNSVMQTLVPSLNLTSTQKPGITDIVSGFLTKKADILPLKASNPTSYKSKFGSLFGSLKSQLGGALTSGQLTKFLSLKPKTDSPSNVLSNLFY